MNHDTVDLVLAYMSAARVKVWMLTLARYDLDVVSYNYQAARTLRIWDGKCCQQPIRQEVFSP